MGGLFRTLGARFITQARVPGVDLVRHGADIDDATGDGAHIVLLKSDAGDSTRIELGKSVDQLTADLDVILKFGGRFDERERSRLREKCTTIGKAIDRLTSVDPPPVQQRRSTPTKIVAGQAFPAASFAHVPDPRDPSTWSLRIHEEPGRETRAQVKQAIEEFTDKRHQIAASDMPRTLRNLRGAWVRTTGKSPKHMPEMLKSGKETDMRVKKQPDDDAMDRLREIAQQLVGLLQAMQDNESNDETEDDAGTNNDTDDVDDDQNEDVTTKGRKVVGDAIDRLVAKEQRRDPRLSKAEAFELVAKSDVGSMVYEMHRRIVGEGWPVEMGPATRSVLMKRAAIAEVDRRIAGIVRKARNMSREDAVTEVFADDPELYGQYVKESEIKS